MRRGLPHDTVGEERGHLHAEGRAHRGRTVPSRTLRPGVPVLLLFLFVVDVVVIVVVVVVAVVAVGAGLKLLGKKNVHTEHSIPSYLLYLFRLENQYWVIVKGRKILRVLTHAHPSASLPLPRRHLLQYSHQPPRVWEGRPSVVPAAAGVIHAARHSHVFFGRSAAVVARAARLRRRVPSKRVAVPRLQ